MDPNACLAMIHDFVTSKKEGDIVDEWCENLYTWIQGGGFPPHWDLYPLGTSYYRTREVSMRKQVRRA